MKFSTGLLEFDQKAQSTPCPKASRVKIKKYNFYALTYFFRKDHVISRITMTF